MKHVVDYFFGKTAAGLLQGISGATLAVYVGGTNTLASLYSDNGVTVLGNPVATDTFGKYDFYVADGRYDLKFTGSGFPSPTTFSDIEIADLTEDNTGDQNWNAKILTIDTQLNFGAGVTMSPTSDPNTVVGVGITSGAVFGVPKVAGDPNNTSWGPTQKGRLWFNTVSNLFDFWDGTQVQAISASITSAFNTISISNFINQGGLPLWVSAAQFAPKVVTVPGPTVAPSLVNLTLGAGSTNGSVYTCKRSEERRV